MAPTTGDRLPAAGPAERLGPPWWTSEAGGAGGSGLFTLLWLVFFAFLIFEPERLTDVWLWFRELPLIVQVIGWLVLLPLVLGLVVWNAPWPTGARITVIGLIALLTIGLFSPRRAAPRTS